MTASQIDMRQVRGTQIAQMESAVKRVSENLYQVNSQSGNGAYDVLWSTLGWKCNCPDHTYREAKCKHIWACELSLRIRREVQARIIEPNTTLACRICGEQENI